MNVVYFAQRGGCNGPIKIGFTRGEVLKRLRALRSHIKSPVFLLAIMPGAREKEQKMHRKFSNSAIGSEWFNLSPEIIDFISGLESGFEYCCRARKNSLWTRDINLLDQ